MAKISIDKFIKQMKKEKRCSNYTQDPIILELNIDTFKYLKI